MRITLKTHVLTFHCIPVLSFCVFTKGYLYDPTGIKSSLRNGLHAALCECSKGTPAADVGVAVAQLSLKYAHITSTGHSHLGFSFTRKTQTESISTVRSTHCKD